MFNARDVDIGSQMARGSCAIVAAMLFALAGQASAGAPPPGGAVIHFDNDTVNGGTLSYAGGGGALVGANIAFDRVFGENTPLNNGVAIDCISCVMSFTTGNLTSFSNSGGFTQFLFGAGGTFTVTGGLSGEGINVGQTTLVTGSFNSTVQVGGSSTSFIFQSGAGTDTKIDELVEYYFGVAGIPFEFAETTISSLLAASMPSLSTLNAGADPTNGFAFVLRANEADLINVAVPLPAAAWLFGSGLLGLAGIARRRVAA